MHRCNLHLQIRDLSRLVAAGAGAHFERVEQADVLHRRTRRLGDSQIMVVDVAQLSGDLIHALPMLPLCHNRGGSPNVHCIAPSSRGWLTIRNYRLRLPYSFLGSRDVHESPQATVRPSGLSLLFSVRKQQMPSLCAHLFYAPISQQSRVAVRYSSSLLCAPRRSAELHPTARHCRDHGGIRARRLQAERSQEGSHR